MQNKIISVEIFGIKIAQWHTKSICKETVSVDMQTNGVLTKKDYEILKEYKKISKQ